MLAELDLNKVVSSFDKQSYGTCIGPHGNIYICDNTFNRILKVNISNYEMILNEDKLNDEIDYKYIDVEIFAKDVHLPNYSNWVNAREIGLNFVNFPEDTLQIIQSDSEDESE